MQLHQMLDAQWQLNPIKFRRRLESTNVTQMEGTPNLECHLKVSTRKKKRQNLKMKQWKFNKIEKNMINLNNISTNREKKKG